jgi:hypothetical protein
MNRDVLLLGHKLDMTGIDAVLIEAAVMELPPPGAIRTGLKGNGPIPSGPCNSVGVFWLTAASASDRRIATLARTASVPIPASGCGVDGVFAFQTGGSTYSGTFYWHVSCPLPARRPES